MIKNCFVKIASVVLLAASVAGVFDVGTPVYAEETTEVTETAEHKEISPEHLKFVGRLYTVINRQDICDQEEKKKLAESLDEGISAAYSVMFRFYFSDKYRALDVTDEQFIEDLYVGCYGRYSNDKDKNSRKTFLNKLDSGISRYLVFKEFISSNEFVKLCKNYDINVKTELVADTADHKYGMTCIGDDYYDFDKNGNLGQCYKNAARHLRNLNEQLFRSPTKYFIIADIDYCYLMIFKGSVGNWELEKLYLMSCGKPGNNTPKGTYKVTKKLSSFISHDSLCYYATQWNGPYYFHSVTYDQYTRKLQDGRLGKHVSAGCIRLRIDNAKWIYKNIPKGTTVKTV